MDERDERLKLVEELKKLNERTDAFIMWSRKCVTDAELIREGNREVTWMINIMEEWAKAKDYLNLAINAFSHNVTACIIECDKELFEKLKD